MENTSEKSSGPEQAQTTASGLSSEANNLAVLAVQQFRTGLSQALLYSVETKQFEKAAEAAFLPMNTLVEAIGAFTLVVSASEVMLNGSRVEMPPAMKTVPEALHKVFHAAGLSSLKFERGATAQELGLFMSLLAKKKIGGGDGAKTNKFLREQNITHISAGELRYVAIGATDRVIGKDVVIGGAPGLANAAAQGAAVGIAVGFLQTAQRITDPVSREQLRAEMIEQLIEKDEGMLGTLLLTASQRLKLAHHEKYREIVALPRRDGELLKRVLQLSQTALQARDEATLTSLKPLIAEIVAPYRNRAEDLLANVPFQPENAALLPEWLTQAYAALKGGSAAERLEGILTQSPHALLDKDMFMQIVDVLDELSVAGMSDEAQRLTTHVSGALRAVTKAERMQAVQRLSMILQHSLEQCSPPIQILENALLGACAHETCDEVLQLLLSNLSSRCVHHYHLGNFERALEHLRGISALEESSRVAMRDEGANLARHVREELAKTDFGAQLSHDLLQPDEKGKAATEMARVLGKDIQAQLIERIRNEHDVNTGAAVAAHLPKFGPDALKQFFAMLAKEEHGPTLLRLIGIATVLGNDNEVPALLPALLRHKDENVRAHALQMVMQKNDAPAAQLIIAVLHEETALEKRKGYIVCLVHMSDPSALEALLAELEAARTAAQPDDDYVIALLEALSWIGKAEIVPAINKMLGAGRGRTLMIGAGAEPLPAKHVVMAAIKAIAKFYKDPVVGETFERLRKDKDPDISRLALVALRGLVAAEQQNVPKPPVAAAPALALPTPVQAQPAGQTRRRHRGFEVLEEQMKIDNLFRVGTGIVPNAAAESKAPEATRPSSSSRINLKGIKPLIEGALQDLGLARTLIMLRGRDGVMKLDVSGSGVALIYVKGRKIVGASFGDKTDLDALVELSLVPEAKFAYYPNISAPQASVDLDPSTLQHTLNELRLHRPSSGIP